MNKNIRLPAAPPAATKIKIGWFSFSCCEDNTIVMTEIMNDHWQEWKQLFDFRHARVLKSQNIFDEFDVAFIEGAIASKEHEDKLKEIRAKSKKLVAVGACAIVGMPAGQRNNFTPEQNAEIQYLIARFAALPKVLKVSEVVKVDAEIPGCPMEPSKFLEVVNALVAELAVNPVRTGASRPADGSIVLPPAISALDRRQSRRRSNGVKSV